MSRFSQLGMTLTETTMALAIVGALGAVAGPAYTDYVEDGRTAEAINHMLRIEAAIENYKLDHHEAPAALTELFATVPVDPWGLPFEYKRFDGEDDDLQTGFRLNRDYELFSHGRDGETGRTITADETQDNVARAFNGGFIGSMSEMQKVGITGS